MHPRIERKRQWISQYGSSDMTMIDTKSSRRKLRPKYVILGLIPTVILVSFVSDMKNLNEYAEVLRRRMLLCNKTPYVSPEQAVNQMPEVSMLGSSGMKGVRGIDTDITSVMGQPVPTYVTMCEELIKRNKNTMDKEAEGSFLPPLLGTEWMVYRESEDVCRDWAHPHQRLMDMIASQVVAYSGANFGMKYDHDCHQFMPKHQEHNFDVTTIQQIYPQLPLRLNENLVGPGDVIWTLCENCLQSQDFHNPYSAYHCLLYPEPGTLKESSGLGRVQQHTGHTDGETEGVEGEEIQWDGRRDLAVIPSALEAALPLVKNRLYHAAVDYSKKSDIPDHDPRSGAVIFLDETTMNIPFRVYKEHMPKHVTHISILASPKCVEATLKPNNILCMDYGNQLRSYMENHFNMGDAEVSFDVVASTATTFSRLILTHNLICGPGTFTCLLPSMARQSNKETVILESVDETNTFHWFTSFSNHAGNIKILPLSQDDLFAEDKLQTDIAKNTPQFVVPEHTVTSEPLEIFAPAQSNVEGDVPTGTDLQETTTSTTTTDASINTKKFVNSAEEGFSPLEIFEKDDTDTKKDDKSVISPINLSLDGVKKAKETEGGSADDVLFSIMKGKSTDTTESGPQMVQSVEGSGTGEMDFSKFGGGEENDFTFSYNDKTVTTPAEFEEEQEGEDIPSTKDTSEPKLEDLEDKFSGSDPSTPGGRFGDRQ